jgi:hypothetical protein
MLNAIICWPYGCIRSQKKDGQYIIKGAGREDEREERNNTHLILCVQTSRCCCAIQCDHTEKEQKTAEVVVVVTILRDFSLAIQ